MKKILFFFLGIYLTTYSIGQYVPKNENEKKYLEKVRKEKFVVGIRDLNSADLKIDGKSLNDLVVDLYEEYLGLNVEVKKINWNQVYLNIEEKKIDGAGLITRISDEEVEYSKKIFLEDLYVASEKIKLETPEELNGKTIYIDKNDEFINILKKYIEKKNLNVKIKKVDDVLKYIDQEIVFIPGFYIAGLGNKISVGKTAGLSIGVAKKYKELIPIINNALAEKYGKEIHSKVIKAKLLSQQKYFIKSLTEDEKKVLKNIKKISVGLESNTSESKYTKDGYIGSLPDILNRISKITGVSIEYVKGNNSWENLVKMFNEKKIRVLPTSIYNTTFKNPIFSKNLYEMNVYFVTNKKNINDKVGVVKNTVFESLAKNYFLHQNIVEFSSEKELIKSLSEEKINGILIDRAEGIDVFNNSKFDVEVLEKVPINLLFQRDDIILKEIFNKAIVVIGEGDINQINIVNNIENRTSLLLEEEKTTTHKKIIIIAVVVATILLIILVYEIFTEKKLAKNLRKDFLTKLENRLSYGEFCKEENEKEGIALLIDLKSFKEINDKFTHKLGDEILVDFGNIIKKVFKDGRNFRISGDEFYSFINLEKYEEKFENFKNECESSKLLKKYGIYFNIGYYKKKKEDNMIDAFKNAGLAIQKAKEKSGYSIVEASESILKEQKRKIRIRELLKEDIRDEIYPVFQPKINVKTGKIVGAEALCRWKNSELGQVFPNEFIPLAEELKLIHLIDYQIAKLSMEITKRWLEEKRVCNEFRMAFNLSMQTFDRSDVVEKIKNFLKEIGISGENIEIEITESALSNNISEALEKIKDLKELGIKIALDDFTAGHSTASLLPVLPIDVVKFDKSLIDLYNKDGEKGRIIYKNLIKMVKDLYIETVAEGAEEKSDVEYLEKEKIDKIQGYYFGKPEIEDVFLKFDNLR